MSRFWGLRSLCSTLRLWQNARPFSSWYMKDCGGERGRERDVPARHRRSRAPPAPRDPHLDDLGVQVPVAAVEVLLQVLAGRQRRRQGAAGAGGRVPHAPGAHLVAELEHQRQLLVAVQDVVQPAGAAAPRTGSRGARAPRGRAVLT